jgi:hypothetical protein
MIVEPLENRLLLSLAVLDAGVLLQSSGADLLVDGPYSFTTPAVADWNNDGKKDLLVGQYYYGNVFLFTNTGTNAAPAFSGGTKLSASDGEITTSYG